MRVRSFYLTIIALLLSCSAWSQSNVNPAINGAIEGDFESIEGLRDQVEQYLDAIYSQKLLDQPAADPNELAIVVARLDPRLKLHRCANPLTFDLHDNGELGGNISVRTRCDGVPNWSIFVQAQVHFSLTVLVARHNLNRGTILANEDVEVRAVAQSQLSPDYVTEQTQIVGKELKRPIQQGQAVRLAMLLEPKVIKRGDAVLVEAQAGHIFVAAPGVALSDGKVGQQIRVKNERSQREVKAEVVGPGRVRVVM